jgi:hypothetical protein
MAADHGFLPAQWDNGLISLSRRIVDPETRSAEPIRHHVNDQEQLDSDLRT